MAIVKTRKRTKRTLTLQKKIEVSAPRVNSNIKASNTLSLKPKKKPEPPKLSTSQKSNILNKELREKHEVWRDLLPLKIGVQEQIFELYMSKYSKSAIRMLLRSHTKRPRYLNNTINSDSRYDLEGNKSGSVLDCEKKHASNRLEIRGQQKKQARIKKGTPE